MSKMIKGKIYSNADLMEHFKVANQGGMRRSLKNNVLLLISDHTKGIYEDWWNDEGVLHYTGMGLHGDQELNFQQNKTVNESKTNGITMQLLEVHKKGEYEYIGEVILAADPYQMEQIDFDDNFRKVWMFPLRLVEDS